jgi:hypothetical protein
MEEIQVLLCDGPTEKISWERKKKKAVCCEDDANSI